MNIKFLNGNGVKLLAAVLMVVDHIGMVFFPDVIWLRAIGRISLPLFAYMFAEGCRYTKNKFNHLVLLLSVAVICQIAIFLATGGLSMCILVTFSLSTLIIYSLQHLKRTLFLSHSPLSCVLATAGFLGMVFLTFLLCNIEEINGIPFSIEYGFWGCMLPVFASVFDFSCLPGVPSLKKFENRYVSLACFAVGLIILCAFHSGTLQWFSLIALIPLLLYNGQRGKLKLKYFFYIFYPAHLGLFYLISYLI